MAPGVEVKALLLIRTRSVLLCFKRGAGIITHLREGFYDKE
ncbi:hypothetical protein F443_01069 [Phytophthora nicotianae P1569]|uniref:Uncharacterized protein n=1 Tax=Phytophthora nicotianae P1569 TaxID=1317065 RepID=V9G021_PHYNI|nr:hypothetical protein F443_01069 [Phytophthora nicotianae P1569]